MYFWRKMTETCFLLNKQLLNRCILVENCKTVAKEWKVLVHLVHAWTLPMFLCMQSHELQLYAWIGLDQMKNIWAEIERCFELIYATKGVSSSCLWLGCLQAASCWGWTGYTYSSVRFLHFFLDFFFYVCTRCQNKSLYVKTEVATDLSDFCV